MAWQILPIPQCLSVYVGSVVFTQAGISKMKCQRERNFYDLWESSPCIALDYYNVEETVIARKFFMRGKKGRER